MTPFKWTLVVLFGLSIISTIKDIDAPRQPMTGKVASIVVLIQSLIITGLLCGW